MGWTSATESWTDWNESGKSWRRRERRNLAELIVQQLSQIREEVAEQKKKTEELIEQQQFYDRCRFEQVINEQQFYGQSRYDNIIMSFARMRQEIESLRQEIQIAAVSVPSEAQIFLPKFEFVEKVIEVEVPKLQFSVGEGGTTTVLHSAEACQAVGTAVGKECKDDLESLRVLPKCQHRDQATTLHRNSVASQDKDEKAPTEDRLSRQQHEFKKNAPAAESNIEMDEDAIFEQSVDLESEDEQRIEQYFQEVAGASGVISVATLHEAMETFGYPLTVAEKEDVKRQVAETTEPYFTKHHFRDLLIEKAFRRITKGADQGVGEEVKTESISTEVSERKPPKTMKKKKKIKSLLQIV